MSLINEALKKAQRNRDPHPSIAGPGASDPLPGPPIYAKPRSHFAHPLLVALATVGVCALLGGGAYVWINRPAAQQAAGTSVVSVSPSGAPGAVPASAAAPAGSASSADPVVSLSTGVAAPTSSAPDAAPVASEAPVISASAAPASGAPAVITVAPAQQPAVAEPVVTPAPVVGSANPGVQPAATGTATRVTPSVPTENPAAVAFIEALRVTGVRASASDPKVLMNDRVYRQQDIVHRELNLRLIRIEPHTLTFTDDSGFVYTKSI